jgi:hypothetical protein
MAHVQVRAPMATNNPLANPLNMGRQVLRPIGRPYPAGLRLKPWPMPNGAKVKPIKKKK